MNITDKNQCPVYHFGKCWFLFSVGNILKENHLIERFSCFGPARRTFLPKRGRKQSNQILVFCSFETCVKLEGNVWAYKSFLFRIFLGFSCLVSLTSQNSVSILGIIIINVECVQKSFTSWAKLSMESTTLSTMKSKFRVPPQMS